MTKLTLERREEVSQIILDLILEEGNITEDEQRTSLMGIAKRLNDVARLTGLPVEEVEAFCWEMVESMNNAQESSDIESIDDVDLAPEDHSFEPCGFCPAFHPDSEQDFHNTDCLNRQ